MKKLAFSLVLFVSTVYADDMSAIQQECLKNQCQAIIDAGSSGSRLYIYASPYNTQKWHVVWNKKVEPGLSSVPVEKINPYLNQLIQIKTTQPISISLYGTAGMRLLPEAEQTKRYQAVKDWFIGHPEWIVKSVRTITGQEEGVFAWLAVQNEMNLLNQPIKNMKSVVEFGGASAQVSIPIESKELKKYTQSDIYPLKVADKTIYVWSKSYLGLGINEVEKNFTDSAACFSNGYPLKNGSIGHGDTVQCISNIESKVDLSLVNRLNDSKNLVSTHPNLNWVALGAVRFTAQTPPFHFDQNQFNLKELREQGDNQFCHQDWSTLFSTYLNDPYLYRECFSASYFYSSLIDGMGINEQSNIYYPDAHAQMDWTLGTLLIG
jgi:hypothetical protein